MEGGLERPEEATEDMGAEETSVDFMEMGGSSILGRKYAFFVEVPTDQFYAGLQD